MLQLGGALGINELVDIGRKARLAPWTGDLGLHEFSYSKGWCDGKARAAVGRSDKPDNLFLTLKMGNGCAKQGRVRAHVKFRVHASAVYHRP